jgi:hypothetical protein
MNPVGQLPAPDTLRRPSSKKLFFAPAFFAEGKPLPLSSVPFTRLTVFRLTPSSIIAGSLGRSSMPPLI